MGGGLTCTPQHRSCTASTRSCEGNRRPRLREPCRTLALAKAGGASGRYPVRRCAIATDDYCTGVDRNLRYLFDYTRQKPVGKRPGKNFDFATFEMSQGTF